MVLRFMDWRRDLLVGNLTCTEAEITSDNIRGGFREVYADGDKLCVGPIQEKGE